MWDGLLLHFTDEKTEAQDGAGTWGKAPQRVV